MLMPFLGYVCVIVGEIFYKHDDAMGWKGDDDHMRGFTDVLQTQKSKSLMPTANVAVAPTKEAPAKAAPAADETAPAEKPTE